MMERVLDFLRRLHVDNRREWFLAHKEEYLEAKGIFEKFALEFAEGIRSFDSSIGPLSLSDITWRINRDTRFSRDKSPYKTHFGVFVSRGGKKSGYSGYYFQVSASGSGGWEGSHVLAAGNYMTDPKAVRILREDILYGNGDFRRILDGIDSRMVLENGNSLKKVPLGFPTGSPDSGFFKLRNFCLSHIPDDSFVTSPDLVGTLVEIFRTTAPFISYVNRAIEYSHEEK